MNNGNQKSFSKEINGTVYALIKIPTDTEYLTASSDVDDPAYTWLHCGKSIHKRVKLDIRLWKVIGPVAMLTEKEAYAIGLMAMAKFLIESGLDERNVLLLARNEKTIDFG